MALTPGTRLGVYEVVASIGEGGMGQVFRARDTKLDRDVAIKALPEAFAHDADRLARFQREAKTLASLNHPNIAAIYGLEESGGMTALVMELVEGDDLSQRIARGAIPLDEALPIARQIAEALEAAHEQGIIHRDLKPANIKVQDEGTVKVLDFGLAKLAQPEATRDPDVTASPTITSPAMMTGVGVILGTAAYMSPEQAKGKIVDRRADIWAFGAVLYEMLTGKQLHTGETVVEIMAAVMKEAPTLERLPSSTPRAVRNLIARCLAKDPRRRLRDIGEARLLLEDLPVDEAPVSSAPSKSRRSMWAWTVAGVLALALASLAVAHFREVPPADRTFSLSIPLPPDSAVGHIALSPDGRRVAMNIYVEGRGQLWVRPLDSPEMRSLPGTDNGRVPFWSPDGRAIGFFADGKLKTVLASGGPPQNLCSAGQNGGGTWNSEGVILFAADRGPIQQVPAAGGECKALTAADAGSSHYFPSFLPDGRHFLYTVDGGEESQRGVYVAALDNPVGRRILTDRSSAFFAPSGPGSSKGHVTFLREDSLMAQPFDAASMQLTGNPFPIAGDASASYSAPQVAAGVSENGLLIYLANSAGSARDFQLVRLDRSGKELAKLGPPGTAMKVALSPDGKTAAVQRTDGPGQNIWRIWLREMRRDNEAPFTFSPLAGMAPVWSPDGSRIAFSSSGNLYRKETGGSGREEVLLESPATKFPSSWSPDGRWLVYTEIDPKTLGDLWMLPNPLGKPGESKPVSLVRTEFSESQGQVSPDGRWFVFTSNKSGQSEIYVRPFPSGDETKVTSGRIERSYEPRWRRDVRELFYMTGLAPRYRIWSVPVLNNARGAFQVGTPTQLFEFRGLAGFADSNQFLYSPFDDGQSFLVAIQTGENVPTLNVITNWNRTARASEEASR